MSANTKKKLTFCVSGINGKMGREVVRSLPLWKELELRSAVGRKSVGQNLKDLVGADAPSLIIGGDLGTELKKNPVDILLDLTEPSVALEMALTAIENQVAPVIGTSGLQARELKKIAEACLHHQVPALVIPNFSLGAALALRFYQQAAKWMPDIEIVEIHHEHKRDAPSGTALETARLISQARTLPARALPTEIFKVKGVRGGSYEGIPIHSLRLPGILAEQTVYFGAPGETVEIKHTVTSRSTYMAGIELALRSVRSLSGLTVGLDFILDESR